ncbi:hypothetical protein [Paenibacillus sediminis]|uniref:Uncharacterized protein n=1 Tax=Paenibacillus sediminis TaxID=664909 RepID=A0ABS4H596_9BACL|nr:hypothetical protein [Paenibacillus sediminis]MBP1937255.1 hypothetical protein [Paenibacillus sediminis]
MYSQIEEYINKRIYDEISEELNEVGRFGYGSDYISIDVIEDIQFEVISKMISDDNVDIDCTVKFIAYVDHNFHVDSREPDIEMSGSMICQVEASITIDILSGHHDDSTKTLDLTSTCIEFNNFDVIEATDPFEGPDQLDGPDFDDDDDEVDYFDDYDDDDQ